MAECKTECKTCGTKFHACSSCGFSNSWEYEYCSKKCWKESTEYVWTMGKLGAVLVALRKYNELWLLESFRDITDVTSDYTMEFITEIEKEIDRFHKEQADKQYAGNITGERL